MPSRASAAERWRAIIGRRAAGDGHGHQRIELAHQRLLRLERGIGNRLVGQPFPRQGIALVRIAHGHGIIARLDGVEIADGAGVVGLCRLAGRAEDLA
jgi:hypothetical protein